MTEPSDHFDARMQARQRTADALEDYARAHLDLVQVRECRDSSAESILDAAKAFRNSEAAFNEAVQSEVQAIVALLREEEA